MPLDADHCFGGLGALILSVVTAAYRDSLPALRSGGSLCEADFPERRNSVRSRLRRRFFLVALILRRRPERVAGRVCPSWVIRGGSGLLCGRPLSMGAGEVRGSGRSVTTRPAALVVSGGVVQAPGRYRRGCDVLPARAADGSAVSASPLRRAKLSRLWESRRLPLSMCPSSAGVRQSSCLHASTGKRSGCSFSIPVRPSSR